jgi:hypothetical protein
MNGTQAYLSAYPNATLRTAQENSFKLLNNTEIKARIEEVRQKTSETLQISKESLIKDLIKIRDMCAEDPKFAHNSIKAVEVINKMLGYNAPIKADVRTEGEITINFRDGD